MARLLEVALDGGIRGGTVFHALRRVRLRKVSKLPVLMAASQVEGTGLLAEAWWRWTRALMLGRSYVLVA